MAEALGIASGIIAVLKLSQSVLKYGWAVSGGSKEATALLMETTATLKILLDWMIGSARPAIRTLRILRRCMGCRKSRKCSSSMGFRYAKLNTRPLLIEVIIW